MYIYTKIYIMAKITTSQKEMSTFKKIIGLISMVLVVVIIMIDRLLTFWRWWRPMPSLSEALIDGNHRQNLSIRFSFYFIVTALYFIVNWFISVFS